MSITATTLEAINGIKPSSKLKVLITAGPTCEDIDDVRFITNRSSGKMGIEIVRQAETEGLQPLLILGPTAETPPAEIPVINVRSAKDMCEAVCAAFEWCDALVMSAAVADYTPAEKQDGKIKKSEGDMTFRLTRTKDILKEVSALPCRKNKKIVGFALEPDLNIPEGKRKLESKNLDIIVVNTSASFGSEASTACILRRDGSQNELGTLTKKELAKAIIREIEI